MKPFDELTEPEVLALNDEQIDYYIDRECAEQGVTLVPPSPPQPPTKPAPENDVTAYQIAGILVTDMSEAQRLRDCIAGLKTRGGDGYSYPTYRHYFKAEDTSEPIAITPISMMSEARVVANKTALDEHEAQKKVYDKANEDYQKAVTGRDRVARAIRERLSEVREKDWRRQELQALYDRYLPLANGDRTIAARFLRKAHHDAPEFLPNLFVGIDEEPARELMAAGPISDDDIPY